MKNEMNWASLWVSQTEQQGSSYIIVGNYCVILAESPPFWIQTPPVVPYREQSWDSGKWRLNLMPWCCLINSGGQIEMVSVYVASRILLLHLTGLAGSDESFHCIVNHIGSATNSRQWSCSTRLLAGLNSECTDPCFYTLKTPRFICSWIPLQ